MAIKLRQGVVGFAKECPSSERFAAIIDLENVAILHGQRASPAQMQVLLNAIGTHVSEMPVRLAAGINALQPYLDLLSVHQWGLTLVKTEPEAADKALYEAARHFIRCGATDILVISGDHSFVPLAAYANLHVISHASHLSKALRFAATTVRRLPDLHAEVLAVS